MKIGFLFFCFAVSLPVLTHLARGEESGGAKLVVHEVLPSATDKNIDKFSGDGWMHWTYFNPAAPARHQVIVFLAGTGGTGKGHRALNQLAANEGYHLVSLAYPSEISISHFHKSVDPDAFLKARENIIYGKTPFAGLDITPANSIQNRLLKLLQYLAETYPQENWSQYFAAPGRLEWGKLVLAGQSQGGGHACLIALQHPVARVLMFGSPKDFNINFNKPATWFAGPNATPLNRYFSFVHSADSKHGCTYPQQLENYRALKLIPKYPVINVDETPPPFAHSRLLTSQRPQENPHGSVILDAAYQEVWKYLLEEAVQ